MATSIIKSQTKKWQVVTLPFTPPQDGILAVSMRCGATAGRYYVTFNGTVPTNIADAYGLSGQYACVTLGVTAGTQVSKTGDVNLGTAAVYAYLPASM